MPKLNVSRRQDRLVMAGDIRAIVSRGWTITDEEKEGTRELWIELKGPRGLSLTIDLDGDSRQQRQGTFVLSWHIDGLWERVGDDWRTAEMRPGPNADVSLSRSFAPSVNQFHWHKATDVCEGFDDLLRTLKVRMASAVDGTAFQ